MCSSRALNRHLGKLNHDVNYAHPINLYVSSRLNLSTPRYVLSFEKSPDFIFASSRYDKSLSEFTEHCWYSPQYLDNTRHGLNIRWSSLPAGR